MFPRPTVSLAQQRSDHARLLHWQWKGDWLGDIFLLLNYNLTLQWNNAMDSGATGGPLYRPTLIGPKARLVLWYWLCGQSMGSPLFIAHCPMGRCSGWSTWKEDTSIQHSSSWGWTARGCPVDIGHRGFFSNIFYQFTHRVWSGFVKS